MSIEESEERTRTLQNTYRVEPKRPFDAAKIKIHLKNVLELNLKEIEYSDQGAKELCLTIVEEIKTSVKNENFDRYPSISSISSISSTIALTYNCIQASNRFQV